MEWTPANTLTLGVFIFAQLVQLGIFVWYLSGRLTKIEAGSASNGEKVDELKTDFEKHSTDFERHVTDATVHTTLEQRKDINRRIDKLEETVKDGYKDMGTKIDRLTDHILRIEK
jgi:hypothetical protein